MEFKDTIVKFLSRHGYEIKCVKFRKLLYEEYNKSGELIFIQVGANDGVRFD